MNLQRSVELSRCRLEIIDNRLPKRSMATLWKMYGGDDKILMNGPFFNMATKWPLVHMKIHEKVICQPNYQEYGIAWNDNEAPVWTILPTPYYQNYFTNTVVITNGTKRTSITSHPDADGTKEKPRYTSRPAYGFSAAHFEVLVDSRVSLWRMQEKLSEANWGRAIIGDGGASTAYRDFKNKIFPGRTIPYWILVTILDNEPKGEKPMIEINAYSLKRDGAKILSKNFKVREFKCVDGSDTIFIAPKLVETLQKIRDKVGKPININSGYRTEPHNKKIGGAKFSQHMYGTAADISVKGMDPSALYKVAADIMENTGGLGLYSWGVHVDVRDETARWNG